MNKQEYQEGMLFFVGCKNGLLMVTPFWILILSFILFWVN